MAADKLNKHSKVSNAIRHTSWEMQKMKRKKYSHYDSNTKSRISLEWDDKKECVISKKEQISIAHRELTPFLPSVPNGQNVLGDVFAAPHELFDLNNMTSLLSYEVWQTHLSVEEREFLTQFLPEGAEPHKVVLELLAGNNFCFGNPFLKWAASICSGEYHPDAVLRQEQCNKANKVAYYSELHEYHTKMIESLQLWKERWTRCINPENYMEQVPRPKVELNISRPSQEVNLQNGPQNDLCATSGSCSWNADDKSCNSDSPDSNLATAISASRTDFGNKYYNSSGGTSVARPKKREKIRKVNIECGDGAKYMSYIKVSKEQHERVKSSMKQSNFVLGNLDGFCVQPYEVFEEEERQKLHDHWLHLAKKDLPLGFENWKGWRSAKWQLRKSLMKDLEDKWKSSDRPVLNLYTSQDDEFITDDQDEKFEQSDEEQPVDEETNDVLTALEENMEQQSGIPTLDSEADVDADSQDSDQNQHPTQISVSCNTQQFSPIAINTNNDVITEPDAFPTSLVDYPETINHPGPSGGEHYPPPPSAAMEMWPLATLPTLPNVYYHQTTSVTQDYPSITQSSYLHRRSDGGDSFFNPYASQDRNDLLLHSLFKDPGNVQYPGSSQFPRNLNSSLPLDPRLNIQQTVYSDGVSRFPVSREELLVHPLDQVQGWPAPSHHRLSQSWFADDEVRDGWSGGVVPNHDIGGGGQVDGSLFSVLSDYSGLRSSGHYGSSEIIQSGSYAEVGRQPVQPATASMAPRGANYMSGNEGQLGWMNLPRGLQEGGGKPYARLWNDRDLG